MTPYVARPPRWSPRSPNEPEGRSRVAPEASQPSDVGATRLQQWTNRSSPVAAAGHGPRSYGLLVALPLIVQGSSPANVLGRGAAAWDPCGVPPWNLLRNGRGKPAGVAIIAIARELVGACWEIATA